MLIGGLSIKGLIPFMSIPLLGGRTSSSSSKDPAKRRKAPDLFWTLPSADSITDGGVGCCFPHRVEIALKAGPELHVNMCPETRPQTSRTLASSASLSALVTPPLSER